MYLALATTLRLFVTVPVSTSLLSVSSGSSSLNGDPEPERTTVVVQLL